MGTKTMMRESKRILKEGWNVRVAENFNENNNEFWKVMNEYEKGKSHWDVPVRTSR